MYVVSSKGVQHAFENRKASTVWRPMRRWLKTGRNRGASGRHQLTKTRFGTPEDSE